ncbi:MAG: DUF2183 domain-containing protein [Bdellovibrio sp.]|nr:DUF2183 domain-containing protein [Bdellovibrio sp.]
MRSFILVLVLLLSVSGHASTIMISDIDDTIKLAHVHKLTDSARYAIDDESRFLGMSELYNAIAVENKIDRVFYVSNAPEWLMGPTHLGLLKHGAFPVGIYFPRTVNSKTTHKIITIREIMDRVKPTKVIMVGDNGESDAKFYAQIASEYPGVEFHQYIRDVYLTSRYGGEGSMVNPGQEFFVTPIEIALSLKNAGLLSPRMTTALIQHLVPQIVNEKGRDREGVLAFPKFVECKDFVWSWDDQISIYPELSDLKAKIEKRCD